MNRSAIALLEVMSWIKNWDAGFLDDDSGEWEITEANVQAALKDAGIPDDKRKAAQTYAFDETVEPTI